MFQRMSLQDKMPKPKLWLSEQNKHAKASGRAELASGVSCLRTKLWKRKGKVSLGVSTEKRQMDLCKSDNV